MAGSPAAGSGGSGSPAAGSSGSGNPAAGSGGSGSPAAGTGGTTGTAGGAGTGGAYVSPITLACPWEATLNSSCAIPGCHAYPRGTAVAWAGLILTPDETLISRLKDVPGTLSDINCSGQPNVYVRCEMPPDTCAPLAGSKLVDSQNPEASLVMKKLEAVNCGDVMPMAPGDAAMTGWGPDRKACLQDLVRAIAALPPQ